MFRKLRIFYHDNKIKIWTTIGIIVLIYVIIRLLNSGIKISNDKKMQQNNINIIQNQTTYLPSSQSTIMSDGELSEQTIKEDTDIIKQFVQYGNEKKIEEAYNLLSQDCKNEMFKTVDDFAYKYFNDIFSRTRNYDLETWDTSKGNAMYKMKYLNDIMATGKIEEQYIEDYITIVKENQEKRLNINKFVGKYEINKTTEKNGLQVKVLNRYAFYDYEEYELEISNKSGQTIILDTKQDTESVYVKSTKGVKYHWFGNSVSDEELKLNAEESRKVRVRFNKMYSSQNKDKEICFTDVIFNQNNKAIEVQVNV